MGSTVPEFVNVKITVKITNAAGSAIVSKTIHYTFTTWTSTAIFFDQAILLTAGKQYIAASLFEAPSFVSLRPYTDGEPTSQCGGITVTFSKVSSAEFADSNGSTVMKGRVPGLILRPP